MPTHPPSASDALACMDIHVRKHGGDNAGLFVENFATVAAELGQGRKQILVESAIRSSSPTFTAFADPRVVDLRADGGVKPGFNTTSHLILIARLLQEERRKALPDIERVCRRIGDFTRLAIRSNLAGREDDRIARDMEAVVGDVIDRPDAPHSLVMLLHGRGMLEQRGEDWQFVRGDGRRSVTGVGEELAQMLYAKYFALKGLRTGRLNIYTDAMRKVADGDPYFPGDVRRLREDIALQVQCLLHDADVIVAGGYLPNIGGRRGYSDITGAIIAQAVRRSGHDVAYAIEKEFPIMSGDPSRTRNARPVPAMTYFLGKELFGKIRGANGGAVDPSAVDLAAEDKIPIVVCNPRKEDATVIADYVPQPNGIEIVAVRKVPIAVEITCEQMIGNPGFLKKVTGFFAHPDRGISIDQVATSEGSISLTFTEEFPEELLAQLEHALHMEYGHEEVITMDILRNTSLVFCLGNNMKRPGVAARAALALELAGADIHLITQGLNERVMTFLIDDANVNDAVALLHDFCVLLPEEESASVMRDIRGKILDAVRK